MNLLNGEVFRTNLSLSFGYISTTEKVYFVVFFWFELYTKMQYYKMFSAIGGGSSQQEAKHNAAEAMIGKLSGEQIVEIKITPKEM